MEISSEVGNNIKVTTELLDKIAKLGLQVLDNFPSGDYSFEVFTFITYLERFTFGLACINFQLRNFKDHQYLETSIGLNIRAHLLDFMVVTYLLSYQADIKSEEDKENIERFNKKFDSVITDQLRNTIKYVKVSKQNQKITENQYREIIENLWYTYKFLFNTAEIDYDKPEEKLISTDSVTPRQYFERINSHHLVKVYSDVYDLYIYYSKYEHFGIITYLMQRGNIDQDLQRIIFCLRYMVRGIGACLVFLGKVKNLKGFSDALQTLQDQLDQIV